VDTRSTHAVSAFGTENIFSLHYGGVCNICAQVAGTVVNVTITGPRATGYLTAYPYGDSRPIASSLNFSAGQTIANSVMVGTSGTTSDEFDVYNASAGTVQLVVDQYGTFIAPWPVPASAARA